MRPAGPRRRSRQRWLLLPAIVAPAGVQRAQQPAQRLDRSQWRAGAVPAQVEVELPVRGPAAARWAQWTASAVLPTPAVPVSAAIATAPGGPPGWSGSSSSSSARRSVRPVKPAGSAAAARAGPGAGPPPARERPRSAAAGVRRRRTAPAPARPAPAPGPAAAPWTAAGGTARAPGSGWCARPAQREQLLELVDDDQQLARVAGGGPGGQARPVLGRRMGSGRQRHRPPRTGSWRNSPPAAPAPGTRDRRLGGGAPATRPRAAGPAHPRDRGPVRALAWR
jgi:hypothetical protein